MPAIPIWRDKFVNLGSSAAEYRVMIPDLSSVIFTGKAQLRPGSSANKVKINDICADFLSYVLPNLGQAQFTQVTLPVTFKVQKKVSDSWTDVETVQFLNDWSYDYNYNPSTMGMSFPINGRIDARQPIVWTGLNVSSVSATIRYKNGTTSTVTIQVTISGDFSADFNSDFSRSVRAAGSGTAVFMPSHWQNVDSITIGNSTFKVVTECGQYAVYYINQHGGWDTLLVEGNVTKSNDVTRYIREMEYDNNDIQNRGKENFVNEIMPNLKFSTGLLTDEQSSRMHHLLNSPDVFIWDFATQQMIPVIVTDTSFEVKTYRNQGNRMFNYTFNVQLAQERVQK